MTTRTIETHGGTEAGAREAYKDVTYEDVEAAGKELAPKGPNRGALGTIKRAILWHDVTPSDLAGWSDQKTTDSIVGFGVRSLPFLNTLLVRSRRIREKRAK